MDDGGLILAVWGYALVGLANSGFALRLVRLGNLQTSHKLTQMAMIGAVVCSALWGWFALVALQSANPLFGILSRFADQLRYACWFGFLLSLLRSSTDQADTTNRQWMWVFALSLTGVSVVVLLMPAFGFGYLGESARLIWLCSMALPLFAMVLLEQVFRNATEDSRWNIKPLSLGLAGTFLFDLYLFSQAALFNRPDVDALNIRGAIHALMVPLLLMSSSRRSDWISKIHLSPKAAFHSATLLMAGIYLLFISGVGYYVRFFGGDWGRALQLALVFVALVMLVTLALSGSMRAKLRVFLGKHFFRYRYDYREEWLRFTRTLSVKDSPQEMGLQVIRGLAEMLESPAGGLWLRNQGEAAFSQLVRWNQIQIAEKEEIDSPLCQFMVASGWVINLEEFRSFSRRYGQLKLPSWLQELPHAWLVVPLTVGDDLIGFVVLASARTQIDVNWEVNDLLKTAGQQAASYLAQMQATEALLEVRKFDAFNRMSAFVVHDLKNIVTQLSLMMKNAKRLSDNPEFRQDMLLTVENSLDRMRQLMLQLREGATPPGVVHGVDLRAIITRAENVAAAKGRTLKVELLDSVAARGHEDRLERIIGHVVQNALDATSPNDLVSVRLDRTAGLARVVVTDTGQGMSQEFIRDRLFKPFQSTKQAGMGIGAYESYQYVQELGGKLLVESQEGKGTSVTIMLPLFESQNRSDLHAPKTQ